MQGQSVGPPQEPLDWTLGIAVVKGSAVCVQRPGPGLGPGSSSVRAALVCFGLIFSRHPRSVSEPL